MPPKNLLGLGKKPEKGFEQEEVTGNSFSSLLVEETSLSSKKSLLEASLSEFEEEGTFLPLPTPFQQSYEAISDLFKQGGV